ncbi:hypothetical protein AAMO2058_000295400 [Amorphochlora amoebiformis]
MATLSPARRRWQADIKKDFKGGGAPIITENLLHRVLGGDDISDDQFLTRVFELRAALSKLERMRNLKLGQRSGRPAVARYDRFDPKKMTPAAFLEYLKGKTEIREVLQNMIFRFVRMGEIKVVKALIERRTDPNREEKATQDSALTIASFKGYTPMVELLLSKRARVNHLTCHEETALRLAVRSNHTETALVLLHAKADVIKGKGEPPILEAIKNGNHILMEMIYRMGKGRIRIQQEELHAARANPAMEARLKQFIGGDSNICELIGHEVKSVKRELNDLCITCVACGEEIMDGSDWYECGQKQDGYACNYRECVDCNALKEMSVYIVNGAGRRGHPHGCNGRYYYDRVYGQKPLYKSATGAILYFLEGKWRLRTRDATGGWQFSSAEAGPEEKKESFYPVVGKWNCEGYQKGESSSLQGPCVRREFKAPFLPAEPGERVLMQTIASSGTCYIQGEIDYVTPLNNGKWKLSVTMHDDAYAQSKNLHRDHLTYPPSSEYDEYIIVPRVFKNPAKGAVAVATFEDPSIPGSLAWFRGEVRRVREDHNGSNAVVRFEDGATSRFPCPNPNVNINAILPYSVTNLNNLCLPVCGNWVEEREDSIRKNCAPINIRDFHSTIMKITQVSAYGCATMDAGFKVRSLDGYPSVMALGPRLTTGKWQYEVRIQSAAQAQIGWAIPSQFKPKGPHLGVGDCKNSWGYDGAKQCVWRDAKGLEAKQDAPWEMGSYVSCAVDMDRGKMKFYLDSQLVSEFQFDHKYAKANGGLTPAATFAPTSGAEFVLSQWQMVNSLPDHNKFRNGQRQVEKQLKCSSGRMNDGSPSGDSGLDLAFEDLSLSLDDHKRARAKIAWLLESMPELASKSMLPEPSTASALPTIDSKDITDPSDMEESKDSKEGGSTPPSSKPPASAKARRRISHVKQTIEKKDKENSFFI